MPTTRLLKHSKVPFDRIIPSSSSSSSSSRSISSKCLLRFQSRASLSGDHAIASSADQKGERKHVVAVKASMTTTNHLTISRPVQQDIPQGLSELLAEIIESIRNAMLVLLLRKAVIQRKLVWNLHPQMVIEKAIIDCRFFTLFAVAGSLLGSVLCFLESSPRWLGMQSIEQAKSKIGHAVMMILQVGLIEKFNDVPLVTGVDLACFAAALVTSSATIFVLSRLNKH
ncbi:hypothetical protein TSUD_95960 [Trifolium subterraneum]|uniref:Uncharacterized protein n=1 Tax=Trifolium subterraneum TaxID=3900 RepID=A0A2Z6P944_TRISU|nr:hypothetical protein TSUD_95960 [Trifolium subterraneum]